MVPTSTPAQLLEDNLVLTMAQIAFVLDLTHLRGKDAGKPDPRLALQLVRDGQLRLVDRTQPITRWRVSTKEVRRYLDAHEADGFEPIEEAS